MGRYSSASGYAYMVSLYAVQIFRWLEFSL